MQFMLILNETAEDFARRADPGQAGDHWGGWTAFIGAMAQAGIVEKGDRLQGPQKFSPSEQESLSHHAISRVSLLKMAALKAT